MVLPDGMSYRVLVLPEIDRMTPRVMRKIRELVAGGATVVGPEAGAIAQSWKAIRTPTPKCNRWPPKSGAISMASRAIGIFTARAASCGGCRWRTCSASLADSQGF